MIQATILEGTQIVHVARLEKPAVIIREDFIGGELRTRAQLMCNRPYKVSFEKRIRKSRTLHSVRYRYVVVRHEPHRILSESAYERNVQGATDLALPAFFYRCNL